MATKKQGTAFYEAGSWYHRMKTLQEDGSTKYSKKGGFATAEEAEKSYRKCEEEYARAYRNYHRSGRFWIEGLFSLLAGRNLYTTH